MRGDRTETKLNKTIGPVNKKMQPTKVTWQQTGEVMREQESAESAKCLCVLGCVLENTTVSLEYIPERLCH